MSNDLDITVDTSRVEIQNDHDLHLLTGGDITFLSGYQQYGTGDVVLVAGWDGSGYDASVDFGTPVDFCAPVIGGELDSVDFDGDSFGSGLATITIGDGAQTEGIAVGTRGSSADTGSSGVNEGVNRFAAHAIVLDASDNLNDVDNDSLADGLDGYAQLGFHDDDAFLIGSRWRSRAAPTRPPTFSARRAKRRGISTLNGGDAEGAYAQVGHGGLKSADNRQNSRDWEIDISF